MITLDQIQSLDAKVQQAVEVIGSLRKENRILKEKLSTYENKVSELEVLIEGFKSDQGEIEEGIQMALQRLDLISENEKKTHSEVPNEKQVTGDEQIARDEPAEDDSELMAELEEESGNLLEADPREDTPESAKPAELDIF